ncbi:tail fiber domain-containing protein [Primorskyibacter sp. 2E107]|uniref:tail fiber domain-containing protein n=1 Tax=Primorskyibacter sp. 2E107 TaxID=3403458 RepID=UPI003AF60548
MKKLFLTTALATGLATAGYAQQAQPKMSQNALRSDMIVSSQSAGSSSAVNLFVPLMFLVILGVAAASGGGGHNYYYIPGYEGHYVSDATLKTDIARVGQTASGLPLYHYRYKGYPDVFEGVLAQDLLTLRPDAVTRHSSGTLLVNYDKIDATLRLIH